MAASEALTIAGEAIELHADRAIYWPRRQRLLIADLHLGKGDVFRRSGIGLPRGGTSHDLGRLSRLLATTGARELWVLGDVLHGAANDTAWQQRWRRWRAEHPGVQVAALTGNHDRALAGSALPIDALGPAVDDPPFALRHHPQLHPSLHVLAGHLHPCVALPGLGGRRCPVFWLRDGLTVLPAFSAFTGGMLLEPARGLRLGICADDELVWFNR